MKKAVLALLALAFATSTASAQVYVKGYTKRDGTYVAPHYRSSPNSTAVDNWSTRGNVNPYTGAAGTRDPYSSSTSTTPLYDRYQTQPRTAVPCYFNCPK